MAIAHETTVTLDSSGASQYTLPINCTGSDRILLVMIGGRNPSQRNIQSVTHNGVALTQVGTEIDNGDQIYSFWYLLAPATGAQDIVITFDNALICVAVATCLSGVDQAAPDHEDQLQTASATSVSRTNNSSVDNSWFVDGIGIGDNQALNPDTGQTERGTVERNFVSVALSTKEVASAGAAQTGYSWSTATNAGYFVVVLAPAGGMVVPQSVSGAGTNSGALARAITRAKSLSGASTNSGLLSTQVQTVVSQLVTGVSTNAGAAASQILRVLGLAGASTNAGALSKLVKRALTGVSANSGLVSTVLSFSAKWSIEHLEARTDYGFPTVWVEVEGTTMPTGAFPAGAFFERRISELPRLQEAELDSRFGISGFQSVTLRVDNSDGLLNNKDLQGYFVRVFFVDESGTAYKEFKGKVADWMLSHVCTVNVEDVDAIAITHELPLRTLIDVVEAEKAADAGFASVVIANDLGKPVPIIFGRAVKAQLLYVKADETNREYDYLIGEGVGLGGNFQEVFTVYRNDQALDTIIGNVAGATSNTLTLESTDQRPDSWYKYWWVEITAGPGAGQIRHVTAYDSATNKITVNSSWSVTPNTSSDYRLREWRFYDGSQSPTPYAGYAAIRFKKRMGVAGRTDPIYADANGLQSEVNVARALESVLSSTDWGLGLSVDTASFDTAAALTAITAMKCEGAISSFTSAIDFLNELLSFRDMVLSKTDSIQLAVDQAKSSGFSFGLGDETGWNNILNPSPEIAHIHPNEKVKNLKVRYRKNNKENDLYMHELERSSSSNGVDTVVNLPFVYDHTTADRWLDYKRKRYADAVKRLSIDVGQDGKDAKRGDLATIIVPTLGLQSDEWEVVGASVTPAGDNNLSLVPYSDLPYTYVPITSEGGTLPVDESFDITPDYSSTLPDPVSSLIVTPSTYTSPTGDILGRLDVSWTPPNDPPYEGAEVFVKENGEPATAYKSRGVAFDNLRLEGLENNKSYDVKALSVNGELRSIATESLNNTVGSGLPTPSTPATPAVSRFGRQWRFTVAPNPPSEKISHYVWEVATSAGVLQDTIENAGTEINWNASGTSSVSYKARVKAVNIYGQESAFSAYSSAVSNEQWQQGHMGSGSIGNAQLQTDSVGNANLQNLSVDTAEIVNLAAQNAKIDNLAVDELKRINTYTGSSGGGTQTIPANRSVTGTVTVNHNLGKQVMVTARLDGAFDTDDRLVFAIMVDASTPSSFTLRWVIGNLSGSSIGNVIPTIQYWYW